MKHHFMFYRALESYLPKLQGNAKRSQERYPEGHILRDISEKDLKEAEAAMAWIQGIIYTAGSPVVEKGEVSNDTTGNGDSKYDAPAGA